MNDNSSHTSRKCKYRIVFAPKYRRKNVYAALKGDKEKTLRQLRESNPSRRIGIAGDADATYAAPVIGNTSSDAGCR